MINKEVKLKLLYELENLHHVVVQATSIDHGMISALQLLHKQTDTIVYQTRAEGKHIFYDEANPVLYLNGVKNNGKAGGHTQTWVYAGKPGFYFVGTKPKKHGQMYWDSQIARVHVANRETQTYNSNTQLSRLSYVNRAGYGYGDNSVPYPGKELERLEATVSPDLTKFLIASIDLHHVGHFALYDLKEINEALDQAGTSDVNIQNLHCLAAFTIPDFNTDPLHSIQGYAIDNANNIYISSQPGPSANFLGMAKEGLPREIVKIPWGEANSQKWMVANLNDNKTVNSFGFVTEFESIQIAADQKMYLTVAYHRKTDMTTLENRVFEVAGF